MTNTTQASFSAGEFLQKLLNDEITIPIILTGMVKKPDEGTDHFLFTHGSDCAHWVKIPVTCVENVEVLNVVPCKDHTHPLIKLQIKRPQSAEGLLFLALAQLPRVAGMVPPHLGADPNDADACFRRYQRLARSGSKKTPLSTAIVLSARLTCVTGKRIAFLTRRL